MNDDNALQEITRLELSEKGKGTIIAYGRFVDHQYAHGDAFAKLGAALATACMQHILIEKFEKGAGLLLIIMLQKHNPEFLEPFDAT